MACLLLHKMKNALVIDSTCHAFTIGVISLAASLSARIPHDNLRRVEERAASSGIKTVDCIYVINLDERPERWERARETFRREGLHPTRLPGINGWKLSKWQQRRLQGWLKYDPFNNPGRMGCALSHLSAWRDGLEQGYNTIWVAEDDVVFAQSGKMLEALLKRLEEIDPEWDVLYTDRNTKDWQGHEVTNKPPTCAHPNVKTRPASEFLRREAVSEEFERLWSRWGTYSMLISQRGLQKLVTYHWKMPLWTRIDVSIHHVPGLRQYATRMDFVTHTIEQRASDTDHHPGDL